MIGYFVLSQLVYSGIMVAGGIIGGVALLKIKGEKIGFWFAVPPISWGIINVTSPPHIGVFLWCSLILILYLYIKPKGKKWSEDERTYWFNMGVILTILLAMVLFFIVYMLRPF